MTQENKDIQPLAEPHIVKSHDIHINSDYADWMVDIKSRYLFYAEKIEKLKQLVLVNGTEKMHQVGAELMRLKLYQVGGDIQRLISKFDNKIEMAFLLLFKLVLINAYQK